MKFINLKETFWQRNQGLRPEQANYSILKQAKLAWGDVVSTWHLSLPHLGFVSFLPLILAFLLSISLPGVQHFWAVPFYPHLRINVFRSITCVRNVNFSLVLRWIWKRRGTKEWMVGFQCWGHSGKDGLFLLEDSTSEECLGSVREWEISETWFLVFTLSVINLVTAASQPTCLDLCLYLLEMKQLVWSSHVPYTSIAPAHSNYASKCVLSESREPTFSFTILW